MTHSFTAWMAAKEAVGGDVLQSPRLNPRAEVKVVQIVADSAEGPCWLPARSPRGYSRAIHASADFYP